MKSTEERPDYEYDWANFDAKDYDQLVEMLKIKLAALNDEFQDSLIKGDGAPATGMLNNKPL